MYKKKGNIFGAGGVFGGGSGSGTVTDAQVAEILSGYHVIAKGGTATSTETLTKIDGGTATSNDALPLSGGTATDPVYK